MSHEPRRAALALALLIAAVSVAGCAFAPEFDGGIVGTGNRMDCAAAASQERPDAGRPEECKPEARKP